MVFSDPVFLLAFLPASLLIFHLTRVYAGGTPAVWALLFLSLVFYAYWSVAFMLLLLAQIGINYTLGLQLERTRQRNILALAVIFNLCLLGYFKYRNFFLENVGDLIGAKFYLTKLIIPLGISFHTFQQIALLVDIKNGEVKVPPLLNYVLFVLFFPQLIAGPIVLHREMGKQIAAVRVGEGPGLSWFVVGLFVFVVGLFKKVCLADSIAPYVDIAFAYSQSAQMSEAWTMVIAYALQLYFDFSGYSDMAVGLGLMFGFRLPNNFLIPYTATSMIEFWKRWHITMTRFFTMYVYTPLWLRIRRHLRRSSFFGMRPHPGSEFVLTIALPIIVTFFLSGLWHGAGWTFICFGLVHGVGLAIASSWNVMRLPAPPRVLGWTLTMTTMLIGMAYFRSSDLAQAHHILHQMFMPAEPLVVPTWVPSLLPLKLQVGTFTLFAKPKETVYCLSWMALLAFMVPVLPPISANPLALVPSRWKAVAMAGMAWLIVGSIGEPRTFLYFAF